MEESRIQFREDFVDPADVWDPELTSPIPKIIGGLLTFALLLSVAAWGIGASRYAILAPILGGGYALGLTFPAIQRLRAFRRYEAWMAAPQPPPRHVGSLIAGGALLALIALGVVACWLVW